MQEEAPKREEDRRENPRRDLEPIRWREIAKRRDQASLPFLRYFDERSASPNQEQQPL